MRARIPAAAGAPKGLAHRCDGCRRISAAWLNSWCPNRVSRSLTVILRLWAAAYCVGAGRRGFFGARLPLAGAGIFGLDLSGAARAFTRSRVGRG